jgi:hypothetical protein
VSIFDEPLDYPEVVCFGDEPIDFPMFEQELLAYEMPITKVIEDNSVKDIQEVEWHSWEDIGMGFGNIAATRKLELYTPWLLGLPPGVGLPEGVSLMHINLSQTFDKPKVLEVLKENRDKHSEMVKEAKEGYLHQAENLLAEAMQQLADGELTRLAVRLNPPQDHDTIIKQLEMSEDTTIKLSTAEVRTFIMDEWDWSARAIGHNARFSQTARLYAEERGYGDE